MRAGSIDQLPSGNWRVRVRQTDGSRITLRGPFTSEDEARLALAKYEARMLLGVEQHEERRGPRFHAYALNVLDGRDLTTDAGELPKPPPYRVGRVLESPGHQPHAIRDAHLVGCSP